MRQAAFGDPAMKPVPDGQIAPRRRGRPKTGRTPAKVIQARSKANLEQAGGCRLTVNLCPAATDALQSLREIRARLTLPATERAAVEDALLARVRTLRRRKP